VAPCAEPVACGIRNSTAFSVLAIPVSRLKTRSLVLKFADGAGLAGLRVPFEAGAVDLVEAPFAASVDDDIHIVQLGASALLERDGLAGLNGEERAVAFGLGDGEALSALLDLDAKLVGNVAHGFSHTIAPVDVKAGDHHHHENGGDREPASQAGGVHGSSLNEGKATTEIPRRRRHRVFIRWSGRQWKSMTRRRQ
jgi:hypothetical protein